jgi:hypothetical protein
VQICTPDDVCRIASISDLFVYENFGRAPRDVVEAGDICAVTGLGDVMIGQTIACRTAGVALPTITVEEPTVRMSFSINTSPFAGKEVSQTGWRHPGSCCSAGRFNRLRLGLSLYLVTGCCGSLVTSADKVRVLDLARCRFLEILSFQED